MEHGERKTRKGISLGLFLKFPGKYLTHKSAHLAVTKVLLVVFDELYAEWDKSSFIFNQSWIWNCIIIILRLLLYSFDFQAPYHKMELEFC